jgi:hypothetical protein
LKKAATVAAFFLSHIGDGKKPLDPIGLHALPMLECLNCATTRFTSDCSLVPRTHGIRFAADGATGNESLSSTQF